MRTIRELYEYREMIFSLVKRDLRGRYKGSVLGFAWMFINPLLQLIVYTLVFSVILRNGIEDYYLFLFVALIPWIFFSTCISGGCTAILAQGDIVKKIYFPREVLPVSFVTSQFINMLLSFLVVFAVLLFSGKGLNPFALIYLPVIMLVEYILALGFTFIFCSLTVYFRDLVNILNIIAMAWQFLTPVMYSEDMVPENLLPIFRANPMEPIIIAYRDILYYKRAPHLETLLESIALGLILLILGAFIFRRLQRGFAENI